MASNRTVQSLLLNLNKKNLKVLISDLLLFQFQFHIPFAQLWIWEYIVFSLLRRLNCPLNLSSEQRKVSLEHLSNTNFFWSENSGLLGIKSFHGRVDSSSWYTRSWAYIVLPRIEPHWQLPSLLVHWSYGERNIQEMLYKYGGVRRQKHGKSRLPNCTYRQNRSLL